MDHGLWIVDLFNIVFNYCGSQIAHRSRRCIFSAATLSCPRWGVLGQRVSILFSVFAGPLIETSPSRRSWRSFSQRRERVATSHVHCARGHQCTIRKSQLVASRSEEKDATNVVVITPYLVFHRRTQCGVRSPGGLEGVRTCGKGGKWIYNQLPTCYMDQERPCAGREGRRSTTNSTNHVMSHIFCLLPL